ncbi:S-adenosyl-L-methionine-dependent methyltransferase [Mycena albidolilacea]|uniref:Arsenite methyltransferase n=1 Tax=Mycena albidolilacea TaxID=1033008 RepID=A0AAD6ZJN7_9AGAR|nr:S-adenosyl-L-methionine-dependent methyltransferase [Mycena albidolilacea]
MLLALTMATKYDDSFLLQAVHDSYSSIAKTSSAPEYASAVAQSFGYTAEQLAAVPIDSHMGLGCGNPTVTATLKPGEAVLDLGSGGGIDIFLAALKIGPGGIAIGLDMSADMVKRARNKATERGLFPPHVSFVQCLLTEPLPILSNSVDCVLSNCVINLLPPSGKNHIFHEIYRVLKPGGRVVLDDILAKEEFPAGIRDDMAQYVGCIGGAIPADGYRALLNSAGFKETLFVDSRADLNIYKTAAGSQSTSTSCCGPRSDSEAIVPVSSATISDTAAETQPITNSCYKPRSSTDKATVAVPAEGSDNLDLNHWAASYQIYARKPDDPAAPISRKVLKNWWDAFPAPSASSAIPRISPVALVDMLHSTGTAVTVIDVRSGEEYQSGHVAGSHNFAAQSLHPILAAFHAQFADASTVVFYCGGSNGRAPRCAGWYQDHLDCHSLSSPAICILDGGIRRWLDEYSAVTDLVQVGRTVV